MSTIKFPMGKPSYGTVGKNFSAKSLFTNAVLNPDARTFDLNLGGTWRYSLEDLANFEGDLGENQSFEDLRSFYGIRVSPKALVHAGRHSGQQLFMTRDHNDQSLVFRTTYAKLRVVVLPTDREVPPWA